MTLPELLQRLEALAGLEPNWNGYGAPTPTEQAVRITRETLSFIADAFPGALGELRLVPAVNGGMRLEWVQTGGRELTVVIPPSFADPVECYRCDDSEGFEEDTEEPDLARLPELLTWLGPTQSEEKPV